MCLKIISLKALKNRGYYIHVHTYMYAVHMLCLVIDI